ncbi:MAG: primary-amine oxidase [Bacteriodetes bacterium]|nr:primary-amine oxidase [Bacteroidota bacterium]
MQKILLLCYCLLVSVNIGYAMHPLAPLTLKEYAEVKTVIIGYKLCPSGIRFVTVSLHEPLKNDIRTWQTTTKLDRKSFVVLYDNGNNKTYEAIVNITTKSVEQWKEIQNVQPMVLFEEYDLVPQIVKSDIRWIDAMKRRGITNIDDIIIDSWAAGAIKIAGMENARLLRAVSYVRGSQTNFYGRPIEGVTTIVNINTKQVVQVTDDTPLPLPESSLELDKKSNQSKRPILQPIEIKQTKKSFTITDDNLVQWQNWKFRYSLSPREGLVLHQVQYVDKGIERNILHRIALSEMVVPYGDTSKNWTWRNAFDVGEYGIGNLTFPMDRQVDMPMNAQFIDAVLTDNNGNPLTRNDVIAVYERDGGLLWKHYEQYSGKNESRRGRELVVTSIATVGNYDYSISYIFRQDGGIDVQAQLTGIMLPKCTVDTTVTTHDQYGGHLVTKRVVAPNHQHFFNFRIDMDVDGTNNTVSEIDAWAPPEGTNENPNGNAIVMDEVTLRHEKEAQRSMNMQKARVWKISNSLVKNKLGASSAYLLLPGSNAVPYITANNIVRKRAGFIDNHLWVTRYKPTELYAAGDYPNQSQGGDGLPMYCSDNEDIENTDLVVWYTMGVTHLPRNEEYPIMNVHKASFSLYPAGFFDINPALDVR